MKNKSLNLRISERRLNKLRLYSAYRDKTMTQILEDFIDSLKIPENDNWGAIPTHSSTDG
jgi:hypothetical protein